MFVEYINSAWGILQSLAPWLFLGAGIAGILHVFLPTDFIRRHLGRRSFGNVLKAVLLGVPMPLCSCGVIPTAVGLKKDGASVGAAVGFLISTPQTGVDSIAVSGAFLGWPFAVFKVAAAFVTGLFGGVAANVTEGGREAKSFQAAENTERRVSPPPSGLRARVREVFAFAFDDLLHGIWKWIAIGVLISAAISVLVPQDALSGKVWTTGLTGMVLMLLISLPLYVCATGSVPIAASLVAAGMSPGTALVFLMAGPATNAATLGVVYKTFGKKVLAIYLATLITGSMLLGWLFDFVIPTSMAHEHAMHASHPGLLASLAAFALLVVLAWYLVSDIKAWLTKKPLGESRSEVAESLALVVKGMTCGNCARSVRNALLRLPGVAQVSVELETGTVRISGTGLSATELSNVVHEAGFDVVATAQ